MAVASYNTDSMNNQVDIIDLGFDKNGHDGFKKINEFKHEFPPTKVMWIPDVEGTRKDILATTAEYLRIWEHQEETNTYKEHKILRNVSDNPLPSNFFYRSTLITAHQSQVSIGIQIAQQ